MAHVHESKGHPRRTPRPRLVRRKLTIASGGHLPRSVPQTSETRREPNPSDNLFDAQTMSSKNHPALSKEQYIPNYSAAAPKVGVGAITVLSRSSLTAPFVRDFDDRM